MLVVSLMILVLGLVALVVLTGCGSSAEETTTTVAPATTTTAGATETTASGTETTAAGTETTTGAVTFDGTITIGALGTMTGSGAMNGEEQIWAQKKAVDDINAAGGINLGGKHMKMELKFVDDKSSETEGAAGIEKLVKVEGLKLILSTQVSPINQAAAIVAEKYQALYMQVVTWTTADRAANYKWCPDLFFAPGVGGVGEVPFFIADMQASADQPTKWGVLTEDNSDGQGLGAGVKECAAKHNANIAEYQTYTPGTKDYSSVILKFKQANVDALVVLCSAADGITFVKQMKEQNFAPKLMMGWKGFWPVQFKDGLGTDSQFILHDGFWSEDLPFTGSKALGEAYRAAHDGNDSVSIGLPYAQVQILAMAIERAGSTDPAAVRDQIYSGTFKGTTMGDITYDAQGCADISPLGLQWIDGKRVVIYPESMATGKLQLMTPWASR
jgi:branched-chain amino acid transport system substrate-binding protein